jgi:hypothetical protein
MRTTLMNLIVLLPMITATANPVAAQDAELFGTAGTLGDRENFNPPEPASYQALTTKDDAANLCLADIANQYGHRNAKAASAVPAGEDRYLVKGTAEAANGEALEFFCRVIHGEVATLHLVKAEGGSTHGSGLLAIRLDGLETTAPAEHTTRHPAHTGSHAAHHDLTHVRKACHHELRRHLAYAFNGPAEKVRLGTAHLRRRTLSGHGQVNWADGGVSRINYHCALDRYGQVVDGSYSYY